MLNIEWFYYNFQMAERLARIYGTEMDKVNCPFYLKMGACRYGDSCERIHNKPPISQSVMLVHMYENSPIQTALTTGNIVSRADAQAALNKFEQFYEDVFKQMSKYGQIQEMIIVDNLGDHIVGNVYVRYTNEDYAENAIKNIHGRFFNGKKIDAQYSSVTDFGNAKCKQYLDGSCKRGGFCNYMHIKPLSKSLKKQLMEEMHLQYPEYKVKREMEEMERLRKEQQQEDSYDDYSSESERSRSRHKEKKRQRSREKNQKDKKRKSKSKSKQKQQQKQKQKQKQRQRDRDRDREREKTQKIRQKSKSQDKKQKKQKKEKRKRQSQSRENRDKEKGKQDDSKYKRDRNQELDREREVKRKNDSNQQRQRGRDYKQHKHKERGGRDERDRSDRDRHHKHRRDRSMD